MGGSRSHSHNSHGGSHGDNVAGRIGGSTQPYAGAKLIVLDEAARIDDALIAALRPMMATVDGSLIMLTTPAGKRGEFYRAWTEGEGWTRVRVPASQCPRLSKEFLDEEKRELGPQMYRQEYELEFVEDAGVRVPGRADRAGPSRSGKASGRYGEDRILYAQRQEIHTPDRRALQRLGGGRRSRAAPGLHGGQRVRAHPRADPRRLACRRTQADDQAEG